MSAKRYPPPLDPALARLVNALDDDAAEFFQERAAIRTFDGKQDRAKAEADAWIETQQYIGRRHARAIDQAGRRKDQK